MMFDGIFIYFTSTHTEEVDNFKYVNENQQQIKGKKMGKKKINK
jgi:hypothetical protein